ncbi:hypothetical protein [Bifidobacterium cuniculi]|uniref:DUF559 domain-containing protein n=1 Tax=Bifidobacterium cuniculi TaxID=1688 RepID=A0A087AWR1_9BIFI|nr:hypothetical protein [Bifidobacterium cuniculi]KFI63211.1 hypothetical protein BCUN_1138 [Bifidobacterium cuniculi]
MQDDEDYRNYDHELAKCKIETVAACHAFEGNHRFKRPYVYGLMSALQLLGIELPIFESAVLQSFSKDKHQVVVPTLDQRLGRSTKRGGEIRSFAWNLPLDTVEVSEGITCTSPVCTWTMLAQWLSFEELVLLGYAIRRRKPLHPPVEREDFEDYMDRVAAACQAQGRRLPKGMRSCRLALPLIHGGTDSRQEARLILALLCHGLPLPARNATMQAWDGSVFSLDAAYPEARLAVEYDGKFHREQWQEDSDRRALIEETGWIYVQVTEALFAAEGRQAMLVERLAALLAERTGIQYDTTSVLSLEELAKACRRRDIALGRRKIPHSGPPTPAPEGVVKPYRPSPGEITVSDEWIDVA